MLERGRMYRFRSEAARGSFPHPRQENGRTGQARSTSEYTIPDITGRNVRVRSRIPLDTQKLQGEIERFQLDLLSRREFRGGAGDRSVAFRIAFIKPFCHRDHSSRMVKSRIT